jgi:hypothetical protein
MLTFLWTILRTAIPLKGGDKNGGEEEFMWVWMYSIATQKGQKV